MRMREEHRVHAIDAGAQRLRAEIGRGIDQDVVAFVAHQNGRPQAVVARIGGRADAAVAAHRGTPTLVPEPSTVILNAGAGIQAF